MNMFCKHEWKVLSETTTASQFEHAISVARPNMAGRFSIPSKMCDADRKYIQIVACDKCGKLKRFIEKI